eukprot:1898631-Pleurochrysis_carterae.AAC.1
MPSRSSTLRRSAHPGTNLEKLSCGLACCAVKEMGSTRLRQTQLGSRWEKEIEREIERENERENERAKSLSRAWLRLHTMLHAAPLREARKESPIPVSAIVRESASAQQPCEGAAIQVVTPVFSHRARVPTALPVAVSAFAMDLAAAHQCTPFAPWRRTTISTTPTRKSSSGPARTRAPSPTRICVLASRQHFRPSAATPPTL